MAEITVPVRALAYHLHPDESLVEERGPRPGVRTLLEETSRPDKLEAISMDSTIVKVHPDRTGRKKTVHRPAASPAGDGHQDSSFLVGARASYIVKGKSVSPGNAGIPPA